MTDLPAGFLASVALIVGLVIGSFLNVVAWRVPRGASVVSPPSACPECGAPIRPRDNVPVVSWLILRGRCRDCKSPISARYPVVEIMTGLACLGVYIWSGTHWVTLAWLYLACMSIALALIDLEHHRLPNAIVYPSMGIVTVLLTWAAFAPGSGAGAAHLLRAVLGGLALFAFYAAAALVYPAGMGWGDVKLAAVIGLAMGWIGWGALLVGTLTGFVAGALVGVVVMVLTRQGRKAGIPFGPWMLLGMWVGVIVGPSLWSSYLGVLGL